MNFKTIVTFNAILITIFGSAIALFPEMMRKSTECLLKRQQRLQYGPSRVYLAW
jgi:hypothetical protein